MRVRPDDTRDWSGLLSIVALSLLVLGATAAVIWRLLPAPKSVAAFGEAFGGIAGTLISSFALVLLVFTVLQQQRALGLQREELSLQRQEQRDTREELKRTADAQAEQVRIAQLAARLNAAIALLDLYDFQTSKLPSSYPAGSEYERRHKEIQANREDMQNELFRVRNELVGAVQGIGAATNAAGTASGSGEAGS